MWESKYLDPIMEWRCSIVNRKPSKGMVCLSSDSITMYPLLLGRVPDEAIICHPLHDEQHGILVVSAKAIEH